MSTRLPVASGAEVVRMLQRKGWRVARQKGSHVCLKHTEKPELIVVPLHRELKRGTLDGILKDAGIEREDFQKSL